MDLSGMGLPHLFGPDHREFSAVTPLHDQLGLQDQLE
jgi:hypothetical protein